MKNLLIISILGMLSFSALCADTAPTNSGDKTTQPAKPEPKKPEPATPNPADFCRQHTC